MLIAPDVCRYTFQGTYLGRPVANVLDMVIQDQGIPEAPRGENIGIVGGKLIDNWFDLVQGALSMEYEFTGLGVLDLNSEDGTTGVKLDGNDHDAPFNGGAGGDPISANTAILISKETFSGRGSRKGRWFLPGIVEGQVNGNMLGSTFVGNVQDLLDTFLEQMTETGEFATIHYFPTVIHTTNTGSASDPVIEYVNNTQIYTLACQARVASQRRRNRP